MSIVQNDFSAGWCPADDNINGRPNGLLQMDNVDLDTNGALSLIGGTIVKNSGYPANAFRLYSRTMGGARKDYAALADGSVYRNATSLTTGGNTSRAGFSSAFDFVLIASGTKLLKDNGTTAINLGVLPPTAAPTVSNNGLTIPFKKVGDLAANTVTPVGTSAVIGGAYLQITANASGQAAVQTYAATGAPFNDNLLTNDDIPVGTKNTGFGLDSDTINITGYLISPVGKTLKVDVLLAAGNVVGDPVSDYYTTIIDLGLAEFDPISGVFTMQLRRDQFTRVGNGVQDWSTVYGFRLTFNGTASEVINIFGSIVSTTEIRIQGGTNAQLGTYQYLQVNVNNTGSYFAQSIPSTISNPITLRNNQATLTPQNPTAVDAQVNEVWIYRRGGLLDTWYRVKVFTTPWTFAYDAMGDLDALKLNIKLNTNLISVRSIPDPIFDIIGPIQQRWYYFTANLMYPSDYNNPDSVDPTIAIRTTGSTNELFLWAQQVDRAVVMVGTSTEIYILSGTFATLPDFTIDIFYHGIGCKFPPLTADADTYSGAVVYLANDGWRSINTGNENPLLVAPNLDTLYRGISSYGYPAPNLQIAPGSAHFPICIAQNKLWCFPPAVNGRCEVFDLIRKYWRTFNYHLDDATAVTSTQDGQVLAFYSTDKKTRDLNVKSSKLIDGVTKQQVNLRWTVRDGGTSRQRKDSQTFKTRLYTGINTLDTVTINIVNELNVLSLAGTLSSQAPGLDKFIDLSVLPNLAITKTYQVTYVAPAVTDFLLEDWSIDYQLRPPQVSFLRVLNDNFGNGSKKRIRNWPMVIDTLGGNVIWTPSVDNTGFPPTTLNTPIKSTKNTFYTSDAFGVDYGGTLHSTTGLFEFFEMLPPANVQTLPIAKRFDQVGPEDFFKYGKIKMFELRVLPLGVAIPYNIYMSDLANLNGVIETVAGIEESYYVPTPKGTSGRIVRITFGPTTFDFHRFYVRLQVAKSGADTDLTWITVASE